VKAKAKTGNETGVEKGSTEGERRGPTLQILGGSPWMKKKTCLMPARICLISTRKNQQKFGEGCKDWGVGENQKSYVLGWGWEGH